MIRRTAIVLMVTTALAVTVRSAQKHPDFSGRWKINAELSDFGAGRDGKPRAPRQSTVEIKQDGKSIEVVIVSSGRDGKERKNEFRYSLEGKKSKNKTGWGKQESEASWIEDGQVLEISSVTHMKRRDMEFDIESHQLFSLVDGRLVIDTVRYTQRGDFETKAVYDRIVDE